MKLTIYDMTTDQMLVNTGKLKVSIVNNQTVYGYK